MATVNPYITFSGNCEDAFKFYKSIFGGEFPHIARYKDMPSDNLMSKCDAEKIMHISLPISDGSVLMGCDTCCETTGEFDSDVHVGNNISLSITVKSEEEATRIFEGLSKGGGVNMPLQKTFWNSYFGMLIDKFGINWMVSYDYPQN